MGDPSMNEQDRFWGKVEKTDGCWLWTGAKVGGYGHCWFRGGHARAHRASWCLTNGSIPEGLMVLHTCDVPACVKPSHLYLGVHSENMRDAVARKRMRRGDGHGLRVHPEALQRGDGHWSHRNPERVLRGARIVNAKLDVAAVRNIRARLAAGATQLELAKYYGVSRQTVGNIVLGRAWNHVAAL